MSKLAAQDRVRAGDRSRRAAVKRRALSGGSLGLGAGLALLAGTGTAQAQSLPVGGTPVDPAAITITQGANQVTINQTSDRGVINWQSFDVAQGNRVVFNQGGGATLNRVTGGASSTIAGQITADGAVYLVNPNGIAITATGQVRTGGGFIASTLDLSDSDFAAGTLAFAGAGRSGRISNAGAITAGTGGYVALLGGMVSNAGTISVPLGRVALGSGERIALDLNGAGFLQVALPTDSMGTLIDMGGTITAGGGRIELRAASAADAVRQIVNMSGTISADSATGNGGSIILFGEGGGTVRASGTLSAKATGTTGDGGFVETSGATVDFTGLKVDATARSGATGTWLIDPVDLTVGPAAAATIGSNLATANVTLQTTETNATGPGSKTAGIGDITISSAITWTSANTLSLLAYNNIALNAAITGTSGGLTLTAGDNVSHSGEIGASGAVNVRLFNLTNGNWSQIGTLPAFSATDFRFAPNTANFLRATGGDGSSATPYQIADVYGLQGMASASLLAGNFVLANAIDASGTAQWNGGAGFVAIGTDGQGTVYNGTNFINDDPFTAQQIGFTGSLNGGGFTIADLVINRARVFQGLFGYTSGSTTINNLGLVGGSVSGSQYVGTLVGLFTGTAITNVYATGSVAGPSTAGGLIGLQGNGAISNVYATGSVTGGNVAGGLVGNQGGGTINGAYATGTVSGTRQIGGLIGYQDGGTIANAYASGAVSGSASVGGVIGYQSFTSVVSNVYWDSYSTGRSNAIGDGTAGTTVLAVTSDPGQASAANYAYKSSAYANLTAATNVGTATAAGFAFLPGNSTRPFLAFEVPASGGTIVNSHQLQLIGYDATRLAGSYTLGGNIDLSETARVVAGTPGSYSGMWSGLGFTPIGSGTTTGQYFSGSLNGNNRVISGLTINRPTQQYIGLFGVTGGATISNLVLSGGSVSGTSYVGGLIGFATVTGGTVSNVTSSIGVTGSVQFTGGLIGQSVTTVTGSSSSGTVRGVQGVGGLVGVANANITNSYATGDVSGTSTNAVGTGGLVGNMAAGTISKSYATGNVTGSSGSTAFTGGLVGVLGGSISQAYATGAVTGNGYIGGLVGRSANAANVTITQAYATGAVTALVNGTGTTYVGGLIGYLTNGTVTEAWASGSLGQLSGGTMRGGIAGMIGNSAATLANTVYWDRYSTGVTAAVGSTPMGGVINANSITSDPTQSGLTSYAYKRSAYGALSTTNWVFFDGQTRPFGAWEVPASGSTIVNGHQLQLIGANAASQAGNYTLGGNIDLRETGRIANGMPGVTNSSGTFIVAPATPGSAASYSGMWAPTGFVSLGTNGAGLTWDGTTYKSIGTITSGTYGYGGTFDGGGFTLSNLFINRANTGNTGLFGTVSGTIRNLGVGGSVTGGNATGGLVGMLIGGPTTSTSGLSPVVSNAVSTVNVTGLQVVGGLVGSATQRSTISSSSASGTVSGTNTIGGLIGSANRATVTGFAAGAVSGQGYVGGLIGQQFAGTTTGYATGAVTGTIAVGGLIGVLDGSAAERGTATATRAAQASLSGPSTTDRNFGRITANGTATTQQPTP